MTRKTNLLEYIIPRQIVVKIISNWNCIYMLKFQPWRQFIFYKIGRIFNHTVETLVGNKSVLAKYSV